MKPTLEGDAFDPPGAPFAVRQARYLKASVVVASPRMSDGFETRKRTRRGFGPVIANEH